MAFIVICETMFDITQTGIISRRNTTNPDPTWILQRNQQCNFDTIVQAISLRSQPENISVPVKKQLIKNKHNFGTKLEFKQNEKVYYWSFAFEINYSNAYYDGKSELGLLFKDCDKVPMIKCDTEYKNLPHYLDTDPTTRNIYFEVLKDA